MKPIQQWLDEYSVCHQNPINKKIHWICVPLIVWSLLALLWYIPIPFPVKGTAVPVNGGTLFMTLATLYYLVLSPRLALGGLILFSAMLWLGLKTSQTFGLSMWILALVVFILAWIGQFIGHHYEGKKPALFEDLRYLLIGPIWCLSHWYKKLGIRY